MKMWRIPALISAFLLVAAVGFAGGATYNGYPVAKLIVNGSVLKPDVPAIVMDGRTLVPVRLVAEALGAGASWNEETQTVTISSRPDARAMFCFDFNQTLLSGGRLTLDGWRQYVDACGSNPGEVQLPTPDARLQYCKEWASALDQGAKFTLDGWKLYTSLCSKS